MRVIAGSLRGRTFCAVANETRPTSDRVREAIFSALSSRVDFENLDVLDLFSGSGAFAFECISRGATSAFSIEASEAAMRALKENIAALDVRDRIAVKLARIGKTALSKLVDGRSFDLVFADPPYKDIALMNAVLAELVEKNILREGGLIVLESSAALKPDIPATLHQVREYQYGDTLVLLLAANTATPSDQGTT